MTRPHAPRPMPSAAPDAAVRASQATSVGQASSSDAFRDAMAHFTHGVTLITTAERGVPFGLVATSVCSLSADPPTLIVCINRSASAHDVVRRTGVFAVNVLAAEQRDVAERFAALRGPQRFETGRWRSARSGAPFLEGSVVSLDCAVIASHAGYSHTIFVGELREVCWPLDRERESLLWHRRRFAHPAPMPC